MRKVIAFSFVFAASAFAQQQDFSKVEIKVTKVAGTVYMLEGSGGNIGVSVGDDGIVIVDDQFAPLAPKIRAALKGITDKPIRFILNTHYHGDHTGGNVEFSKDGPTVHVNGEDIRAIHMPAGHTDGDSVIWFTQSNVVHMGDDFFNGTFPFVDLDNGGSVRGMASSVESVVAQIRNDTKIIPGH